MTEPDAGGERLDLLNRPTPPSLDVRVVVLAPGDDVGYQPAEWRDALVEVAHGELDVEFRGGACGRFGAGALLWLDGLGLRALRNRGQQPTVLVAVSRKHPARRSDGATGDEKASECRLNGHDDHHPGDTP